MAFDLRQIDGQHVYTVHDGPSLLGFVAIDSTVCGRARGGLRMLADVSETEIRAAARAMTLKYGFLGLPQGGAKAGVRGDGEGSEGSRRERLEAFAHAAAPLLRERMYVPDADLGTRADQIRSMMESIGVHVGRQEWRANRSGYYTAVSCLAACEAALALRGEALAGKKVAVEGFGSVGSALARMLDERGARVVAVSTSRGALYDPDGLDVSESLAAAAEHGSAFVERMAPARRIEREALLELPVDLLCPCARYHGIHEGNAARVRADIICAGANNPASPEAERMLVERAVLFPPDFVTNCGGVLGGTLEFAGLTPERIAAIIEGHLSVKVAALLERAEQHGTSVREVAEPQALARHAAVRSSAENPSLPGRVLALGLAAYRRGWVPKPLVATLTPRYLARLLGS
jgi:glutamate dehydrogenase (NAD(P)+)